MAKKLKKIALIAGTEATKSELHNQLQSLLEGYVEIECFATDSGLNKMIEADLAVITSNLIVDISLPFINKNCPVLLARRSLNTTNLERLFTFANNTKALLVNDEPETALETIALLKELGINNIDFIPYYPNCHCTIFPELAVTPGEIALAPPFVKEVIDLGPRIIDLTTIVEILERLGLLDEKAHFVSAKYLETIISLEKRLYSSIEEINNTNNYLLKVLNQVNDGIIAFNSEGQITVFNEKSEVLFKKHHSHMIGKNITYATADKSMVDFLLKNHTSTEQLFKLFDTEVIISKFKVEKLNSTVCTIKNAKENLEIENKLRKSLLKKGHISKYRFQNIIGCSEVMDSTIMIAKKLAEVNLCILIYGESGTGKELFAGAIHNESPRCNGPFIAVNFSALSEDLVESELFGYEEGSFTGAKKGGKIGLFELANGGTIMLDEIGDTSLKIQARLLRVLQEKEIMRVGGTEIIPINVRIIAVTNKDLSKMCAEGKFREDLYYRLKKLYLKVPSLRFRKEDIPLLINHFLARNGKEDLQISEEVKDILTSYDWPGNVRELENTIEYMVAVCDTKIITDKHIPQDFDSYKMNTMEKNLNLIKENLCSKGSIEEFIFILKKIHQYNSKGLSIGRKAISLLTDEYIYKMSEEQIRTRTDILEDLGLLYKSKGRSGMFISNKGKILIEQ